MIHLRRIFMVSAALVAITMQGCGCDDNDKYYPPSNPQPQPEQTFTVNGGASKGILRGFNVSAHAFGDGEQSPAIANTTTNNAGSYTLRVPVTYRDQPLRLRVTPTTGSTMVCDLSEGCGDGVDFGDAMPVTDSDFNLEAVVPSAANNQEANINLFTSMAAAIMAVNSADQNNLDAIRAAIQRANSSVANRFGITDDLFSIPVVDLTNEESVRAALSGDSRAIQYAAMNAAIAQAARADSQGDIFAALTAFRTRFTEEGIPGNTTTEGSTSLAEILSAAQNILHRVRTLDSEQPIDLGGALQNLIAEEALANSEEPDQPSQGTPSEVSDKEPLEKVKAMVKDLRDFAFSFGDTSVNGGTIGQISEDFAMQLEAAEVASSEEASHLAHALSIAAKAIDDANRALSNNSQRTSYTSDDGVEVAIAVADDIGVFTVDQSIEVHTDSGSHSVAVNLTATNALEYDEAPGNQTADGRYDVEGSASSDTLKMTVGRGSHIAITELALEADIDEEADSEAKDESVAQFDLNLKIELAQQETDEVVDPVTVKGTLSVSLQGVEIISSKDEDGGNAVMSADVLSLTLAGSANNLSGESAGFVVTVSGDGTGVTFVEAWSDNDEDDSFTGETEDNYAELYGNLAFTARLTGIPNAVSLNFAIARTGYDDAESTLTVRYPGKQLRFHMLAADGAPQGALTVTNQDGVVMSLWEEQHEGRNRLTGNISLNGETYATIEEETTIRILYTDGNFESL